MTRLAGCLRVVRRLASLATLMLAGVAWADQDPEFWQNQVIYQVITDRFYDGDASNNNAEGTYNPSGSSGTSVHGGDFKGVEQKLDYIKSLGATAIWISPVVLNANGEFHGYAARDFYQVAPHWGTLADLQHLIQTAHAKGLLVIDDIIVNHGGDLVYSTDSGYSNFKYPPAGYNLRFRSSKRFAAPFNTNSINPSLTNLFHNNGNIQDFGDDTQVTLGELSGLDDFRTETDYVRTNMAAIYQFWIGQAGFDGFRIDTVKHVEMGFWQYWCPSIHNYAASNGSPNFFMFGEIYDGSESKCGSYTGTKAGGAFALDSVVDYPLFFTVNSVFASASGNTKQIEDHYSALAANYDPTARNRLVTFLDNHDQPRFMSLSGATTDRLKVALVFLHAARGIPSLYYGTEQGFNGANDPYDREDMFDGQFEQGPSLGDNFNMTHPLFQWVAMLNNFRRLYPALRTGIHSNLWNSPGGPGLFAWSRQLGTQEVFVTFNTASSSQVLAARPTLYPEGTVLVNLLDTNETVTVMAGPLTPFITVPGSSAKMFIAQSQWLPLDPVVTSLSPAHDALDIARVAPIVMHFSKPMDTNSVEAAFSTAPAVAGSFAWSAGADTLTFTPGGTGFPAQTMVSVQLADTARDAGSSEALHGAFSARFKTGTNTVADLTPPGASIQWPTNGSSVGGLLAVSGFASDNVAVQKVEFRVDTNAWSVASGTNTWNCTLNTSNFLNGSHALSTRSTDTSGNVSPVQSVNVRFVNVPGAYLQRISAGNPAGVTDCAAAVWAADQAYTSGSFGYLDGTAGNVANTITGVCASAQSLYQRERYSISGSGYRYRFDCPIGVYETTLLEAETWFTGIGQRVFNLFIEGQQGLTNFDIFAAAGGRNLPLTRVFTNSVADGQMELLFVPITDNARASGIQIRKIADLYSDSDGIPDWWRLAYFDHPTGQAADLSRAGDDPDGDNASNLQEWLAGTDPLNAGSVFKIVSFAPSGTNFEVAWPARSNKIYQVQQGVLLGAGLWTNVGVSVTGKENVVTQTVNPAGTSQFYRVRAQ
jgi:alpha-amylase